MSGKKNWCITLGFVMAVSMIAAAAAAWLVSYYDSVRAFDLLNAVCSKAAKQNPEAMKTLFGALKEYAGKNPYGVLEKGVLTEMGYCASDFFPHRRIFFFAAIGFLAGMSLFLFTFWKRSRAQNKRIKELTEYLKQVNTGKALILSASGEDDFSKLEDEIYKTVTFLYQTKEQAVQIKNDFAENLSNIAHQIKTPLTAISLSVQKMKQCFDSELLNQVEKQAFRLMHLEESLLILSRLDAGTLFLRREKTDVYTLLVLAADNLQELFSSSGASIEIPEQGEMPIMADLDWTMEAVMNLMKNCMEHSKGKTVHCSYAQNPLYTEIFIWDEGEGFAKEDIAHLFERFYRGKNAKEGGIGIGLSLAKEIIERQDGTIRAKNRPEGGAMFEIHFYSH